MADPLPNARPDRRRHARRRYDLAGTAYFSGGAVSVRVIDLSPGGARLELPLVSNLYDPQTIIALRIYQILDLRVVWRWSRDRQIGVAFATPALAHNAIMALSTG